VLLVEPAEEFLESGILQNLFDGVELVAELVMRPGFVDEVFAGMAGRNDISAAFATRNDVMAARGNVSFAEDAGVGHVIEHTRRLSKAHGQNCREQRNPNGASLSQLLRIERKLTPPAGLFHRLAPTRDGCMGVARKVVRAASRSEV
jgi:hypothetical protein